MPRYGSNIAVAATPQRAPPHAPSRRHPRLSSSANRAHYIWPPRSYGTDPLDIIDYRTTTKGASPWCSYGSISGSMLETAARMKNGLAYSLLLATICSTPYLPPPHLAYYKLRDNTRPCRDILTFLWANLHSPPRGFPPPSSFVRSAPPKQFCRVAIDCLKERDPLRNPFRDPLGIPFLKKIKGDRTKLLGGV